MFSIEEIELSCKNLSNSFNRNDSVSIERLEKSELLQ